MSTPDVKLQAVLRSACPPSEEQRSRLTAFLEKKYQQSVELSWSEDKSILGGFRIELGTEVIDWTTGGRLDQLKEKLASISAGGQDVIPLIRDTVKSWVPEVLAYEVGTVLRVADGIAYVSGLEHASYGEILLFEGGIRGMVQDLKEDRIGCILFGDYEAVRAGDAVRRTGKTAIAVDTILNQKGKNVVCIYVAIGQKASSVAQLTEMLRAAGALEYTTVVCASASDFASMQYIAPYAGCALGEYFMEKGRDVLIVYDDLSKHAIAYRALSLLLERSPGREAYPGDVFYLHSRLLERSAHLSDERGGGSMTALPIVETLDGDVSAYIPTNIISITDGQIYLESNLFFAGQRPAVNVGLSVSRVGGAAQTKAMKKAVGTLRLDLAQYREMEVFTQFSSDLDDDTKQQLVYGQSLMRILRQGRGHPYSEAEQVVLLVTALGHIQQQLPVDRIGAFNAKLLSDFAASRAALMQDIGSTGVLTDENRKAILEQAKHSLADFLSAEAGSGR